MITMENYEGWLMRYADGALGDAERQEVETFLTAHPELADELATVAAVHVASVLAAMPGKGRLLHRNPATLWLRAAAAVVLLFLAGLPLLLLTHQTEPQMVAGAAVPQSVAAEPILSTQPTPLSPTQQTPTSMRSTGSHPTLSSHEEKPLLAEDAEPMPTPKAVDAIETTPEPQMAKAESPLPEVKVTFGIVVDDARLATNPWLDAFMAKN